MSSPNTNQTSNSIRKTNTRYPRISKTTGLSDYLARKKQLRPTKDNKWQWLTLAALVLSLPAILFSLQSKIYEIAKGSQGQTATAVIVPYDSTITDYQDFRILLHIPDSLLPSSPQATIYVLFDTAHLELTQITPLSQNINTNDIFQANQKGEITINVSHITTSGLTAIAEARFIPRTQIPAHTNINISPNSYLKINDNQTKLIKGNSASIKILSP